MYEGRHIIITAILLLSIASVGGILTRYLRIPYASMLVIIGLFVGIFRIFPSLRITPSLIYYVFLPIIIFEGAVNIKISSLISNILPIGMLSIFGTIISALFTGFILHFVLNFPIQQALIFGAIITPTDPISILALLKDGVKNNIRNKKDKNNPPDIDDIDENSSKKQYKDKDNIETLLTGESLFNDGISLVLFEIFLNENFKGLNGLSGIFHNVFPLIANSTFEFLYESIGGSIVGILLGYGVSLLLYLADDFLTEIMISLLLAYASLSAAYYLHMSFIMAIITSGIVLANYGFKKKKVTTRTLEAFPVVIEYLTFIINSVLFLIIGIEINLFKIINLWSISFFIIALAIFSRFIAVYLLSPVTNFIKNKLKPVISTSSTRLGSSWSKPIVSSVSDSPTLNKRHKRFLVFGGLKGVLPIAMALSLPFNLHLRNEIITYVFIVVLFSLTVQAISFDFFARKNRELLH